MAWLRWSVNCRLLVAQLILAMLLVYLFNISRMAQLDRQLLHSERRQGPVPPVQPKQKDIDEANRVRLQSRFPTLPPTASRSKARRRVKPAVLSCRETRRPDAASGSVWQQQDHPSGTMYVYSAVYDNRTARTDNVAVRLVVLASGMDDNSASIYCQVWNSAVSEPAVVSASLVEVEAGVGKRAIGQQTYAQYIISCPLGQSSAEGSAGELQVSVTVDDPCGSSSVLVDVQRSDTHMASAVSFGVCALLAWPTPNVPEEPAAGQSVPWFVEWIEFQLSVLRASRVFLYVVFDEDVQSLEQLIRFYSDRKSLVVRKIPHPVDGQTRHRRELIANVRGLAVNDCLLRNARNFRYLIDVDADELIVPRHLAFNYSDMVDRIETGVVKKQAPALRNVSSVVYFFRALTFRLDVSTDDDPNASRFTTTGYFRSRDKPAKNVKRLMVDATRCVTLSPSTGCDVRVMPAVGGDSRTAKVKLKAKLGEVEVPLNVAGCHRYRSACAKSSPEVACAPDVRDAEPVKDTSMQRFQLRLKFPVIQALKDSGTLDQGGLYRIALNA